MTPLVRHLAIEQLVLALRDSVLQPEPLGEQELLERYRAEAPGSVVRARQILVPFPEQPTQPERDSVLQMARTARTRIVDDGASFPTVGTELGSGADAADLGQVRRGQLLPELAGEAGTVRHAGAFGQGQKDGSGRRRV